MPVHKRNIMKSRQQILQIPLIGKIVKLTKPNIHIQTFLNINACQITTIHVSQLFEISTRILPEDIPWMLSDHLIKVV